MSEQAGNRSLARLLRDAERIVDRAYAREMAKHRARDKARRIHFTISKPGSCSAPGHVPAECPGHSYCSTIETDRVTTDAGRVTCLGCLRKMEQMARYGY